MISPRSSSCDPISGPPLDSRKPFTAHVHGAESPVTNNDRAATTPRRMGAIRAPSHRHAVAMTHGPPAASPPISSWPFPPNDPSKLLPPHGYPAHGKSLKSGRQPGGERGNLVSTGKANRQGKGTFPRRDASRGPLHPGPSGGRISATDRNRGGARRSRGDLVGHKATRRDRPAQGFHPAPDRL